MRKDRPGAAVPDAQDAYFAIQQFTGWINSADSKAGFLSAALAVVVNGIVLEYNSHHAGVQGLGGRGAVMVAAFAVSALCALGCTGTLVLAIYPRIQAQTHSRYSWPSVAECTSAALEASAPIASRSEAWSTAHSLALITQRKYRFLRFSFVCWIASLTTLLLAVFVSR